MAFTPFPAGVVGVSFNMTQCVIPCAVTMGMRFLSGAATSSDGINLISTLETWFSAYMAPILSADITLNEVKVTDLTSSSGWTASDSPGIVGTAVGNPVANQVAMVVTLQTAKRGRSYRGRNYWPGLPLASLASTASWGPTAVSDMDAAYLNLITALATPGWVISILSRVQGKVHLTTGVATQVVSVRANAVLGTIRGRLS